MTTWQPIENAPKDGSLVDLWVSGPRNRGSRIADCWYQGGKWVHNYGRDGELEARDMVGDVPTHWMLAPSAPEG
jgi:hypothetical protein